MSETVQVFTYVFKIYLFIICQRQTTDFPLSGLIKYYWIVLYYAGHTVSPTVVELDLGSVKGGLWNAAGIAMDLPRPQESSNTFRPVGHNSSLGLDIPGLCAIHLL